MPTTDTLCGWGELTGSRIILTMSISDPQVTRATRHGGGLAGGAAARRAAGIGSGVRFWRPHPSDSYPLSGGQPHRVSMARRRCWRWPGDRLPKEGARVEPLLRDLAFPAWREAVRGPFDAVVSGLAIHHLLDARKRQLYQEVYALLGTGGLFLNNDAVLSPPALQEWFTALWYREMQAQEERLRGVKRSIESIRTELQEQLRVGDHPSYMAPLAVQLAWLSEAGFTSVDCDWKYLDFAIFGGVKG